MVRRFYITGGNNVGDPAPGSLSITDQFFVGKLVTGVFKQGFRELIPLIEWTATGDTIQILTGVSFDINEVIVVEVCPAMDGQTCLPIGNESTYVAPYLPDIIKCVVAKVNNVFENRVNDPFSVYYDHGIYQQVGSDKIRENKGYLFIWLVMPFIETEAQDDSYYEDATCKILIAIGTDPNYTQIQREDINFHPRLLPVYNQLITELKTEVKLDNSLKVTHSKRLLPYWGGGDVSGPGSANLWTDFVDCIEISDLKLKIGHLQQCSFISNF
jgi:hypothetical protein